MYVDIAHNWYAVLLCVRVYTCVRVCGCEYICEYIYEVHNGYDVL